MNPSPTPDVAPPDPGRPTDGPVRWGVVGPGRIADKVVGDVPLVPNAQVVAVASRSLDRAQAFAARHGIDRAYGSYREILQDGQIDALYIATPHPQHRAVALAALRRGVAVLVEKAFTVSVAATEEIVALARQEGVFAMEAMWTRFQPAVVRLRELVADGAIGEIRSVHADLGIAAEYDPAGRFFDPTLGGGALFDIGVYPISFAQMLLGAPESVTAHGLVGPTGVDHHFSALLGFGEGRTATLFGSVTAAAPGSATVIGSQGWIEVPPRFHHPHRIVLHRPGREPEVIERPATGGGYSHELAEVTEGLRAGRRESTVMPLADTVAVQRIMASIADRIGLRPQEGPAEL